MEWLNWVAAAVLFAGAGCTQPGNGSGSSSSSGGVDGGAGTSGVASSLSGAASGSSGASVVSSGPRSSSSPLPDAGCPAVDAGVTEAPLHAVSLEVTNQASTDVHVATRGWLCDAVGFGVPDAGPIPRATGFDCGCECPAPQPEHVAVYRRLAPGASVTLAWDGRRLHPYTQYTDCRPSWGPTAPACNPALGATYRPVAAGDVDVEIGVASTLPAGCTPSGDDAFCQLQGSPLPLPPAVQRTCPLERTLKASFVLPAQGNVAVPVVITDGWLLAADAGP